MDMIMISDEWLKNNTVTVHPKLDEELINIDLIAIVDAKKYGDMRVKEILDKGLEFLRSNRLADDLGGMDSMWRFLNKNK